MEEKPYIDKKFVNRAWREMSLLLDQEMPVVERRRRIAWWWLLAGIGIGIAGLLYYSQSKKTEPAVKRNEPVAASQAHSPQQNSNETVAVQPDGLHPSAKAAISKNPAKTASPSINKPLAPTITSSPVSKIQGVNTIAETTDGIDVMPGSPVQNSAQIQPPVMAVDEPSQRLPVPAMTGSLPIKPIASIYNSRPLVYANVDVAKKGLHLPLSTYGSALANPFEKTSGLALGISTGLPISQSKFSIETSIGYAYVRQPISILVTQQPNPTGGPTTNENTLDVVTVSFDPLNEKAHALASNYLLASQDLRLHYAEMPLSLLYKANRKLQIQAGINLSMLLASSPDFTRGAVFTQNRGTFAATQDQSGFNPGAEKPISISISAFDAAGIAGARFQLTPRLGLGVQYQLGFLDVLQTNKEQDYNRLLRASVFYRLR